MKYWIICMCILLSQTTVGRVRIHSAFQNLKNLSTLYDSAKRTCLTNQEKGEKLIQEGITLATQNKKDSFRAEFLDMQAFIRSKNGDYNSALEIYQQALHLKRKLKLHSEVVTSFSNIGKTYDELAKYSQAQEYHLKALKLADSIKNEPIKGGIYNALGSVYIALQQNTLAKKYLMQGYNICNKYKDSIGIARIFSNIGLTYYNAGNFDSSEYYFKNAERNLLNINNKAELAPIYNNLGILYLEFGYFDKAMSCFNKSLALRQVYKDVLSEASVLSNIGNCYHDQRKYKEALVYLKQAETLALKANAPHLISDIYYNISSAYQELGQYKPALLYQQQYSDLMDTLFTKESSRLMAEMRQKYEAEQSEKEIAKLRTEKTLQQNQLTIRTQQRNMAFLTVGIIVILVGFFAYTYKQKLALNKLIAAQNEEKARQEINNLLKEQEIKAISAMIRGQEQERKRVAEDLHDRLGSLLSTVKLNFSGLEKKAENGLTSMEPYKRGIMLLDEACSEVRKIAYDMAAGNLQKYGFVTSVEELKKSIESSNKIKVNLYTHNTEVPVDKDTEINLYRVTQELISNILKHANATEINIQYNILDDTINLMVEDNGKGFDFSQGRNGKSMGISNIHARVSKLEGNVTFDSTPGRGTTVIINVPTRKTSLIQTVNSFVA